MKRGRIRIPEREGFTPKTNAGARTIPLGKKIIEALKQANLGCDILFPSESGGVHNRN
jgi:hypothetical protein